MNQEHQESRVRTAAHHQFIQTVTKKLVKRPSHSTTTLMEMVSTLRMKMNLSELKKLKMEKMRLELKQSLKKVMKNQVIQHQQVVYGLQFTKQMPTVTD